MILSPPGLMLQILYVFGTAKYSLKPIHRGGGIFCKNYIANLSRNKAVPQQLRSFERVGYNLLLFGLGVLKFIQTLNLGRRGLFFTEKFRIFLL